MKLIDDIFRAFDIPNVSLEVFLELNKFDRRNNRLNSSWPRRINLCYLPNLRDEDISKIWTINVRTGNINVEIRQQLHTKE